MEKAKRTIPVVCGIVGLVAGCFAAYFVLSTLWTRIIVQPADVTDHDLYIVLSLSIVAGIITGFLALQFSAHRYWAPQNRNLSGHMN
jgi:hypothetical protein